MTVFIVCATFVHPVVVGGEPELDDEVSFDDLEQGDIEYVMSVAMGREAATAAADFPAGQGENVHALGAEQDLADKAEFTAGV
jgi:hypothetical protein